MKRILDIVAACAGLILLSPMMVCLAVAVRCTMGSPILFRQERPGRNGRLFRIYKFRTMREPMASGETAVSDDRRLTTVGRWMRRWSLDELPELYNVLNGDMSLVGPRPLLPQYLGRYTPEQARRHEVRPGITGWAQIHGRNAITWEEKFALDVWYVDNRSFGMDLKIIALTMGKVLKREGISAAGEATMPEFMGTDSGGRRTGNA